MSDLDILIQEMNEKWKLLSSSDQFAVERAQFYLECDGYKIENLNDTELEDYEIRGCQAIDEGNAEPEYENEDFYEDICNKEKVLDYLKIKRSFEKLRKGIK